LSACAKWNRNGTTLVVESLLNFQPKNIFVDKNNTVYVKDPLNNRLYKWHNDSSSPTRIISDSLNGTFGLFVSSTGDIYVSNGDDGSVNKWKATINSFETVAQFCQICFTIFIDINDIMYCSMGRHHQIVAKPLHSNSNMITIVAGIGIAGSEANMLLGPEGIFVSINLDLYVADTINSRIQLFHPGAVNGITIAGTSDTIPLQFPTSVVLDANNYIYIVDRINHRIVARTPNGFQCIVSCDGSGFSSDKLYSPFSMTFDSYGNIYTIDAGKMSVRKFLLSKNTCGKYSSDIELRCSFQYHHHSLLSYKK
jgi:hypothetical protein